MPRSGHVHDIAQLAHDTSVSLMEHRVYDSWLVIGAQTGVGNHGCGLRVTVPYVLGFQDVACVMLLSNNGTFVDAITLDFAAQIVVQRSLIGSLETSILFVRQ